MAIVEFHNACGARVSKGLMEKTARAFYKAAKIQQPLPVSVAIIGSREMRKYNRLYRKKDCATDVLSFPAPDARFQIPQEEKSFGEILICYPLAKKQARREHHGVAEEIQTLFIHGLAHTFGFDHHNKKSAEKMRLFEEKVLRAAHK